MTCRSNVSRHVKHGRWAGDIHSTDETRELHVASTRGMQPATRLLEGVCAVIRGTLLQKERWSEVANVKV